MDNQGWIKLYRKIIDNEELFGKTYDFALFTYFILKADRTTGIARVGRQDLAKRFRADESTIYKAMKRIEKGGLINIKSNNQFSDVYICKYAEYQGQSNNESNNKVTTKEQQSNTIQEVRSKKVLSKDNTAYGNANINYLIDLFKQQYGYNPTDRKPRQEAWNLIRGIRTTFKEYGKEWSEEKEKVFIDKYFSWITKQEWASELQNMSTVRRKLPIYKSYLERSINAKT